MRGRSFHYSLGKSIEICFNLHVLITRFATHQRLMQRRIFFLLLFFGSNKIRFFFLLVQEFYKRRHNSDRSRIHNRKTEAVQVFFRIKSAGCPAPPNANSSSTSFSLSVSHQNTITTTTINPTTTSTIDSTRTTNSTAIAVIEREPRLIPSEQPVRYTKMKNTRILQQRSCRRLSSSNKINPNL